MTMMTNDPILRNLMCTLPGKSDESGAFWLPLWMHSLDTAEILERLAEDWLPEHTRALRGLSEEEFPRLCRMIGLLHDLGKVTPIFAARITERLPERRAELEALGLPIRTPGDYLDPKRTPHAGAGDAILRRLGCPEGLAAIVGAHHGKPMSSEEKKLSLKSHEQNFYGPEYRDSASGRLWEQLWREWLQWALAEGGFSSVSELPELSVAAQLLLTGLVIMADWIASSTDYFPLISVDERGSDALYPHRADRAWDALSLPAGWRPQRYVMDEPRFRAVFGFGPNDVQTLMMEAANRSDGGIFILEAQMGVGKTEAALAAAEVLAAAGRCKGVFFGLPTQATANGLFLRLRDWAEKQTEGTNAAIRLAHGMAELNSDYRALFRGSADTNMDADGEDRLLVHPWFNGRKQALLADFVIGTVDQLLLAALKQKHVMLRHLGLAGKVVILDECHAYDAYMNQYLERALNWLGAYRVPVIMLSATLPEDRRVKLIEAYLNGKPEREAADWRHSRAYPLLTWTDGREVLQASAAPDGEPRSVRLEAQRSEDLVDALREALSDGGCCGVIVNTVRTAQELARTLAEAIPDAEVLLYHARFVAPDRAERETALLRRAGKNSGPPDRDRLIVVGTQVLEQSLDIDFDILFTQLCPMDLLLQRLGRLHRHKDRERPERLGEAVCRVLDMDAEPDGGSLAVYGTWLLRRTRALLPERVSLPDSIPELVQETYRDPTAAELDDPALRSAWEEHKKLLGKKKQTAQTYRVEKPPKGSSRRQRSIHGWLDLSYPADGAYGEAAVRDGDAGIGVLVMQIHPDGRVTFLPWQHGGRAVAAADMPDEETAMAIAAQRLTLPLSFSRYGNWTKTISMLEERNRSQLPAWQRSPWLNGELVLLLDEDLQTELCGKTLTYSIQFGLLVNETLGEEVKHGT